MLYKFNVYSVKFSVFHREQSEKWRRNLEVKHSAVVVAKDLNDLISRWSAILLQTFPYTKGTSTSHYDEPDVYGTHLEFEDIQRIATNVLFSDETPGHARLEKGEDAR